MIVRREGVTLMRIDDETKKILNTTYDKHCKKKTTKGFPYKKHIIAW